MDCCAVVSVVSVVAVVNSVVPLVVSVVAVVVGIVEAVVFVVVGQTPPVPGIIYDEQIHYNGQKHNRLLLPNVRIPRQISLMYL